LYWQHHKASDPFNASPLRRFVHFAHLTLFFFFSHRHTRSPFLIFFEPDRDGLASSDSLWDSSAASVSISLPLFVPSVGDFRFLCLSFLHRAKDDEEINNAHNYVRWLMKIFVHPLLSPFSSCDLGLGFRCHTSYAIAFSLATSVSPLLYYPTAGYCLNTEKRALSLDIVPALEDNVPSSAHLSHLGRVHSHLKLFSQTSNIQFLSNAIRFKLLSR
jgi:hypothetical protein